jgi:diguanylate cyclase (GGDEF)-like protein/PAS domain S-box-containing protein
MSRLYRLGARGAAVLAVAQAFLIVALRRGVDDQWLTQVGPTLAAIAAAAACGFAAVRRTDAGARRGWAFLALAAAGWSIAGATMGDLLHVRLMSEMATGIAVCCLLGPALRGAARARTIVDGLVAAASLLFLSWSPVLAPAYRHAGSVGPRLVAVSIPVADTMVLALLLAAGVRVRQGNRRPWALLATGCGLLAAGDGIIAYARLGDLLAIPTVNNLLWTVGPLLVGLAALSPAADAAPLAQDPRPTRPFAILLPYAPFLIAAAEAMSHWVRGDLDIVTLRLGAALLVLLFVRQLLAQLELMTLSRHLDRVARDRAVELQRQEHQFRSLVQHATDVLTVVDREGIIRYQSGAAGRIFDIRPHQLVGAALVGRVHPDDLVALERAFNNAQPPPAPPVSLEVRFARGDGDWATTETTITNLLEDDAVQGMLLTSRDVTDRKRLEQQLRHDALHDPLTGLGNRVLFRDRLVHAAARASRNPQPLAVLMLDLDGFKDVNDTLGHAAGDRLLCEVARRLRQTVRPGDTVSRMGGDEFAILLERPEHGVPEAVAARILAGLRAPVEIEGRSIVPGGSVGVATAPSDRIDPDQLLRAADLAMYSAKIKGKGRFETFQDGMQKAALMRVELEGELRRAIRDGELILHYQPIVAIPSGRLTGAEALVRWNHPEKGLIPPSDFVPIAEQSDLVVDLGRTVLWQAARQLQQWQAELGERAAQFSVAVNVASRQLLSPWLVEEVRRVLDETRIDPSTLVLEITEGALMSDTTPIEETLQQLRALGVRLAIDDFGTGWSSLARLRAFPVDKLKIDRAFVREIGSVDQEVPLVEAIVAMAHSLGLQLVAEGVETLEQLACLDALGCEEVQGYLLSRPVPAEAFAAILASEDGLIAAGGGVGTATVSDDADRFMSVVASAATAAPDGRLLGVVLDELRRVSGLDAIYLSRIDWAEMTQRVVLVSSNGEVTIEPMTTTPFPNSPCARMLGGGSRSCDDLARTFPGHPLVTTAGVRSHVSIAVLGANGDVWGTLCGANAGPVQIVPSTVTLFEIFAGLINQHLGVAGIGDAAPAGERVTVGS